MTQLLLIVTSLWDVRIFITFFSYSVNRKKKGYYPYIAIIISNFGMSLSHFYNLSTLQVTLLNLWSYILFISFASYAYTAKKAQRFILVSIYILITLLSESLSAMILGLLFGDICIESVIRCGIVFSILIKFLITYLLKKLHETHFMSTIAFSKIIIIFIPVLSGVLLFCYILFSYVIEPKEKNLVFSWLFVIQILIFNFCIFLLYNKMKMETKKEIEYQTLQYNLKRQRQQLDEALQSQYRLQTMNHDFKNSVLVLASYLENKEIEYALSYISDIQKEIMEVEKDLLTFYTPNRELNYLLLHKAEYARQCSIETEIKCLVPKDLIISNELITAVIGNLLDNAINACKLVKKDKPAKLDLKMKYYNKSLFIDIKNSISQEVNLNNLVEGTGIKSIKAIVEKNSGIYKQFIENGKYCVKIIIWD